MARRRKRTCVRPRWKTPAKRTPDREITTKKRGYVYDRVRQLWKTYVRSSSTDERCWVFGRESRAIFPQYLVRWVRVAVARILFVGALFAVRRSPCTRPCTIESPSSCFERKDEKSEDDEKSPSSCRADNGRRFSVDLDRPTATAVVNIFESQRSRSGRSCGAQHRQHRRRWYRIARGKSRSVQIRIRTHIISS